MVRRQRGQQRGSRLTLILGKEEERRPGKSRYLLSQQDFVHSLAFLRIGIVDAALSVV